MEEEKKEMKKEEKHEEHKKEEHKESKKEKCNCKFCKKFCDKTKKLVKKPFVLSTIILSVTAIVLLILVIFNVGIGAVGPGKMKSLATSFFQENFGVNSTITDSMVIKSVSGVYEITLLEQYPFYFTKDGQFIVQETGLIPTKPEAAASNTTTPAETPTNVEKSDKPVVELYVFTYCPYGLQAEKAFVPVAKLLGDKIELKIRQIGAMHGEYEQIEAERQLCVEKNYPAKFLDYLLAFAQDKTIGACSGDATCIAPKLKALYSTLGISESTINTCMKSDGKTMYQAEVANAKSLGFSASPTTTINGAKVSLSRSPEAVKKAVCEAFKTAPAECSQTLSNVSSSAGFGADAGSSTSASC